MSASFLLTLATSLKKSIRIISLRVATISVTREHAFWHLKIQTAVLSDKYIDQER